jgi:hypothetical protein
MNEETSVLSSSNESHSLKDANMIYITVPGVLLLFAIPGLLFFLKKRRDRKQEEYEFEVNHISRPSLGNSAYNFSSTTQLNSIGRPAGKSSMPFFSKRSIA